MWYLLIFLLMNSVAFCYDIQDKAKQYMTTLSEVYKNKSLDMNGSVSRYEKILVYGCYVDLFSPDVIISVQNKDYYDSKVNIIDMYFDYCVEKFSGYSLCIAGDEEFYESTQYQNKCIVYYVLLNRRMNTVVYIADALEFDSDGLIVRMKTLHTIPVAIDNKQDCHIDPMNTFLHKFRLFAQQK